MAAFQLVLIILSLGVDAETLVRKHNVSEQFATDGRAEISDEAVDSTYNLSHSFARDARLRESMEVDADGNIKIPGFLTDSTSGPPSSVVRKVIEGQVTADGNIKISDGSAGVTLKHVRDAKEIEHMEGEYQEAHNEPTAMTCGKGCARRRIWGDCRTRRRHHVNQCIQTCLLTIQCQWRQEECRWGVCERTCWRDKNALEDWQGLNLFGWGVRQGHTLEQCKEECNQALLCKSISHNAITNSCFLKLKVVTPLTSATVGTHNWFTYYKASCHDPVPLPPPWCHDELTTKGCQACEISPRVSSFCQDLCIANNCALRMGSSLLDNSAQAGSTSSLLDKKENQTNEPRSEITPLKSDVGMAICNLCKNKGRLSQTDYEKCNTPTFWPSGPMAAPIQNANRRRQQNCFATDYISVGDEVEYEFGPRMNSTEAEDEIASVCSCLEFYVNGSNFSVSLEVFCSCPSICDEFKNDIGCNLEPSLAQTKARTAATTSSRLGRSGRSARKVVALLKKRPNFGYWSHARAKVTGRNHALLDDTQANRALESRAGSHSVAISRVTAEETLRGKCR